ncbi:hypothetical protein GCM10007304_32000 [Rhodococcoides trifolii]|uniref:Uncharacterized protein n=1 Tax=Rhodococcoides trifolii TaxID=908250 RepID=A0A917FZP5_9NOCA|nr:hypothetical protein [Rhodococcus trifolii]GGG15523.1 hypothetical protein GCM10007304_32000 [Rhodococcus trifolii]
MNTPGNTDELSGLISELTDIDRRRVEIGLRLAELEFEFRKARAETAERRARDAFVRRYQGRILELADGLRE